MGNGGLTGLSPFHTVLQCEITHHHGCEYDRGQRPTPTPRTRRARPQAQGQDAVERGLEEPDRPRGEDRQEEGRDHASGLQTEHAVDLDTGVLVAAPIHPSYEGDTTSFRRRWTPRRAISTRSGWRQARKEPCVAVAGEGYHSGEQSGRCNFRPGLASGESLAAFHRQARRWAHSARSMDRREVGGTKY